MTRLIVLLGSYLGLAREALKHHEAKDSPFDNENLPVNPSPPLLYKIVEEWEEEKEERVQSLEEKDESEPTELLPAFKRLIHRRRSDDFVQALSQKSSTTSLSGATGRLPYPVILPQRRPRRRKRGFMRAYAPVLQDCNVDQKTFLGFLDALEQASKVSESCKLRLAWEV